MRQTERFDHTRNGAAGGIQPQRAAGDHHPVRPAAAPQSELARRAVATAVVDPGMAERALRESLVRARAKGVVSSEQPHPGFSEAEGDLSGEPWQSHFFLAPNVRFTRTPEAEIMKRRGPSEGEEAGHHDGKEEGTPKQESIPKPTSLAGLPGGSRSPAELMAMVARQYPYGPALGRHFEGAAQGGTAGEPVPARIASTAQPAANAPAAPAVPAWQRRSLPEQPIQAGADPLQRSIGGESAPWSLLSDHAFFEAMPLDLLDARPAAREPARPAPLPSASPIPAPAGTKPVSTPPQPATEVTALFRVIECRPAISAAAAAEQPAVSPVPVVVAPAEPEAREPEPQLRAAAAPVEPRAPVVMQRPALRSARLLPPAEHPNAGGAYEFPSEELLQEPPQGQGFYMSQEQLEQNAGLLESVLEDFGVRGEIIHVRPGPVVTMYEFEPAPGVKSSRVINLADDIARSMSAISARVAVIPGRNVIGIELPNVERETVYLRELIESGDFRKTGCKLALCLGKTIGGEPVIAELAKMPHLLVAGTTGSGKSVAINTMILSLLYRLKPEECRLIMVDPKMLELSVYDGIPHLLTPVVTDPKKAVTALKWAVREMEDRYRKMARLGVRNIDGYNQRAATARDKGEPVLISVQTGFDRSTGEPIYEEQEMDLAPMPYIVVIVDEMADLMMVAGKEIEGAIQRLAQMARAAGIHLIMATQRPSVDVITGTIKANFPTRISFQVTSKIDSRTILGEQGAEQLLGQGDMLHMAGGGRIARVHGPFVSDEEVEQVVAHLKAQGRPEYLETVTADEEEQGEPEDDGAVFDKGAIASEDGDDLYDQAVKVVMRDKRCSTSYIQRRLGIGYNRAASLIERMEKEGLVGPANHVGKREILHGNRDRTAPQDDDE
jgi:DNA segregation ATPase FtsK/SpoIIIE, S-DNA-T family